MFSYGVEGILHSRSSFSGNEERASGVLRFVFYLFDHVGSLRLFRSFFRWRRSNFELSVAVRTKPMLYASCTAQDAVERLLNLFFPTVSLHLLSRVNCGNGIRIRLWFVTFVHYFSPLPLLLFLRLQGYIILWMIVTGSI